MTPLTTDILYLVDDPGGAPISKKATVANVCEAGMVDIGARVYNSGDLTIGTGAWTALTFDSERWDTDTIHSTVANTERLTATTAGTYLIIGQVEWEVDATSQRGCRIYLNGATVIANLWQEHTDVGSCRQNVATIYVLSATDYVELEVYQGTGGNLDVIATANYSLEFMMQKIG
jgi:hypothetical protein